MDASLLKKLGLLMVIVGFLVGALASVLDVERVRWPWFIPAATVGVAGVAVMRFTHRKQRTASHTVSGNIELVQTSIAHIVENITALNADKANVDPYDVRHRIDEFFVDDLNTFVEARESIIHAYGLVAYGQVMSSFATGERYLNRVWSASADGYVDEIHTYLDRAQAQFTESQTLLTNLAARTLPAD